MEKSGPTGKEEEKNPRFQAKVGEVVFEGAADAKDLPPLEHAEETNQPEWRSRNRRLRMRDIDAEGGKLDDPGSNGVGHLHVDHDDQHGEGRDNVDESGSTIDGGARVYSEKTNVNLFGAR